MSARPATPPSMEAVARRMEAALTARIGAARYHLWFHRHTAFVPAGRELVVGVASAHFQEWLEQTFGGAIRSAAEEVLGGPTRIRFAVDQIGRASCRERV